MSDNNLSIDEIIKRAEAIKAEADRQLAEAQKSLEEKAKLAIDEVVVDTKAVMEKVESLSQEEDVKSFEPKADKTQAVRLSFNKAQKTQAIPSFTKAKKIEEDDNENDDDMKVVESKTIKLGDDLIPDEKTKPVVIATKDESSHDDLQDIPTLIARKNLKDYLNGEAPSDFQEELGIQMSFEGFDDLEEEVPTIDEEMAERILIEQRKEKVNKFRLFGPDETDEELGDEEYKKTDYSHEKQQGNILSSLFAKKSRIQIQIIITFVFGLVMFVVSFFKDTQYFPQFLASTTAYLIIGLVLLVLTIITNYNVFLHGFNVKKGINFDMPITIAALAVFIQTIAFIINDNLYVENGHFLGGMVAFLLLISQLGKRQMMVRIIDNFDYIINPTQKYCVENIANSVDSEIISRGILEDEKPIIKTSVRTDFPTNFMEISCKTDPSDKLVKILSPIMWCFSLLVFVVIGLIDSWSAGINCGIAALIVSTPIGVLFLMNNLLSDMSADLDKYDARVCGFDGAYMASNTNALVLEASSLFDKQDCELHGIKVFNKAKVDDAIIYAAAVIIQTKSPLAHVFDDVIIGKQSILPKVENVMYEEKMGTSAWIYQRKVLVGNRNLLTRHGVAVPKESFEQKYTRKNRKALYLAINGKIMAMFVVSYNADPELKRELRKLEKSGITLIVKSCDPYINEESLERIFSLPKGFIRVMNYSASKVFEKYSDMSVERSPAYIVHDGSAKGFIASMREAISVVGAKRLVTFLCSFGSALGLVSVAFLSIIGGYSQLTGATLMGFMTIWNLFVLAISKLHRLG